MNKQDIIVLDHKFNGIEIPQFAEKIHKTKGYVSYGEDNLFPYYLISLIAKSPRHAAILKKKASLIGGRGFITTNLSPETMLFLANSRNDNDMEEILAKISYDFELFGGFYLNIIWSKDRTKIVEVNYIDPSKVRIVPEEPDSKYPQITKYLISDGWEDIRKYPPVEYDGCNWIDRKQASQIIYVKNHRAGTEYYAQPDYLPGIYFMEMELKIGEFHFSSANNQFTPAFYINWPLGNSLSDEERNNLANRLKLQFAGALEAGKSFLSFSEDEMKPTIQPIESNKSDERYIKLDELIEKSICHSHQVNDPELFGVAVPKGIGQKTDRVQSLMEFEIDYIIPRQKIIEKVINKIARINGIQDNIMINRASDSYKKVGGDSVQDVLNIITSAVTPEQKYHLLVSLNYTHTLASDLSGYKEGNIK